MLKWLQVNGTILAASVIVGAVACGVCSYKAYNMGYDKRDAEALKQQASDTAKREELRAMVAEEFSKVRINNETIIQPTREIVRAGTQYRECVHDKRVFDNLKRLLSGTSGPGGTGTVPKGSEQSVGGADVR